MGDSSPKTILIVEDDLDLAEVEKIVLAGAGYRVLHAPNAAEGLAQVHAHRPDLILLDVMMPAGTEGFHFVWELRKADDEALRNTPIIIMTAIHRTTKLKLYPDQSDGVYGPYEYLPVQGFLDKPVPSAALLAAVEGALTHARTSG